MNRTAWRLFLICLILSTRTLHAGDIGEVDIHGFISQGYLESTENNYLADSKDGTYQFNEIGINFATWVTSGLSMGIQFFASDLGDQGNDELKIDWAYANFRYKPYLGIKAGKIKIPIGLYNETRDIDSLRTSIFLPPSVYLETVREVMVAMKGVGLYGMLPFHFSYQFLFGTQEIEEESGITILTEQNANKYIPSFLNLTMELISYDVRNKHAGAVSWEYNSLKLKTSYTYTDMVMKTNLTMSKEICSEFTSFVLSAEYTLNDLILAAEYSQNVNDMKSTFITDKMTSELAYVSISNRFTGWLELAAYYSWMFNDKDNKRAYGYSGWFKDTCLSSRFDLNNSWIFKLEGHYFDGTATMYDYMNPDYKRSWYLLAVKFSYVF